MAALLRLCLAAALFSTSVLGAGCASTLETRIREFSPAAALHAGGEVSQRGGTLQEFVAVEVGEASGRRVSPDPLFFAAPGLNAADGRELNLYAYARNNPVTLIDPSGLASVGELIEQKGIAAAESGSTAATAGWAVAAAVWTAFGAEGVSQIADKGLNAGAGDMVGAGTEIASALPPGKAAKVGVEVVKTGAEMLGRASAREGAEQVARKSAQTATESGIGVTRHGVEQKINRQVRTADELDAIKDPLKVGEVKVDAQGRPSRRSVGKKAEVVQNPDTGKIVSVNPTSSKKAQRLAGEEE